MTRTVEPDAARCPRGERGFVLVWMAVTLMVLLGVAAIAVDLTHGYLVQQDAQNAVDAASLAGVVNLPDNPGAAVATAYQVAAINGFTNGVDGVTVTVTPTAASATLQVQVSKSFDTYFGGILGFKTLDVRQSSTAKFDPPKSAASKLDVVMVIDRTQSMNGVDVQNARDAANALLGYLDPTMDAVALGMLGPSSTAVPCANGGYGVPTSDPVKRTWVVSPYPNAALDINYQVGGVLNQNDQIVKTIACFTDSSVGTDLTIPIVQAAAYLNAYGRVGATHVILLETDGQPNTTKYACNDAATAASTATASPSDIKIETIGFGLDGTNDAFCPDPDGPWHNKKVTSLLAAMATPIDGVAAVDHQCTPADNAPGDGFFCEPKSAGASNDLGNVFVQAIAQVAPKRDPRLIK